MSRLSFLQIPGWMKVEFQAPTIATDYDEVPYPGKFYAQSTPLRQASLAMMFGMTPPAVERARVLELGCGDGGNLIPLAYTLPESKFVGVDLASTAVAAGMDAVKQLGLSNVQLYTRNLLDFPKELGQFDYIVAHGIYSWVPPEVKKALFKICERHLAENGVAYISYNALPGGYLRRFARDLMRFHTRAISDPATKVREARNIVEFALAAHAKPTLESEILKREVGSDKSDAFLYHDALSEVNEPVYFLDFLDQAARYGLQFLAEATPTVGPAFLPEHVRDQLNALPDRRIREQYVDLIFGRRFRQTLLCRTGHTLAGDYEPRALDQLLILGSVVTEAPVENINDGSAVEFRTPRGGSVKVSEAIPKAAYLELGRMFPKAISFHDLLRRACARAGVEGTNLGAEVRGKVGRMLLSSYLHGVLQVEPFQAEFTTEVSEKPTASALARLQAAAGKSIVSMALISYAMAEDLNRRVITLADGTRSEEQIFEHLAGEGIELTRTEVRNTLEYLAGSAMLVA